MKQFKGWVFRLNNGRYHKGQFHTVKNKSNAAVFNAKGAKLHMAAVHKSDGTWVAVYQ